MATQFHYLVLSLLVLIFSVIISLFKRVYFHPLSKFPGPILPSLTTFYQFWMLWTRKEGDWYRELHQKYGPVVRVGPNHLSFNDPEMVPIVYHRRVDKTEFHQEFSCPKALFNQKSHVDHAATKRKFAHAFSLTNLKLLEGSLDSEISKWISLLREQASQDPIVNWELWARYFSFDAITALNFGEATGFMDAKSDVRDLITNFDKSMYRQKLSIYPPIAWFARNTPLGRSMFVAKRTDKEGLGIFIAEIHNLVQTRILQLANKEGPSQASCILDQWLSARSAQGRATSHADIEDQLLMDILAGPDSISLMTTNLTFLMAANPSILQKAQREVDSAFSNNLFNNPSSPSYDECTPMSYLNACVREGLRIVAATFPRRRCSPPGMPFYLDGEYVPAGTSVAASACEIGRHPTLYGEDSELFRPERWLEASEEKLKKWDSLDVHWGFGVRKCMGKYVGLMVLYKSLVLLLRNFDLDLKEGTKINKWSYPNSEFLVMNPREI